MDFFNELSKKFTQAARTVQEFTRESTETSRLSTDLKDAKDTLQRQLADLGRAYYDTLTGESDKVSEELVEAVRRTVEQIDLLTSQQERSRQQVRCPGCGSLQTAEARFCSNCGRPMPEKEPDGDDLPTDTDAEYCAECGAMRHGDAKYCAVCGHAFETEDVQVPAVKVEAPADENPVPESEEPDNFEE